MGKKENSNQNFEIKEMIGVLSTSEKGWQKEINLVAWYGGEPKYDIRDWSPDHTKMGKGITLTDEETLILMSILKTRLDTKIIGAF